jgi:hypothetical protein
MSAALETVGFLCHISPNWVAVDTAHKNLHQLMLNLSGL